MGRDKALLSWPPSAAGQAAGGETFLSAAIRSFSATCDFVVVVAGKNQEVLAPVVYAEGASLVVNRDPDRGQFSSLQVGLCEVLNRGRDAAMITLVDRPPVGLSTLEILLDAYKRSESGIWAVVPEYSGSHGHPYLIGREMMAAFLHVPATSTARDVEHAHQSNIKYVNVDDPLVALNINTPEDYEGLTSQKWNKS